MRKQSLLMLLTTLLMFGCAKSVYTDYEQSYPYENIQTFSIAANSGEAPQSLDAGRIQRALKRELEGKGLTEKSDLADVVVRYRIVPRTETVAYGPRLRFGFGKRNLGIGYETPIRFREYTYGQLVIEMIDVKNNQVIWKSMSNRKLTGGMSSQSKTAFFDEEIGNMFIDFPQPSIGAQQE